jgi:hypothetical protein
MTLPLRMMHVTQAVSEKASTLFQLPFSNYYGPA